MRMPAKGLVIHSALQGGNHGGTESTEKVTVGWVEHRETHHFRRDIVSRRVSLRSTHPTSSCPSLCSPCLRGEFAYSAACVVAHGLGDLLLPVEFGAAAGDLLGRQAGDVREIELPVGMVAPAQRRLHGRARSRRGLEKP